MSLHARIIKYFDLKMLFSKTKQLMRLLQNKNSMLKAYCLIYNLNPYCFTAERFRFFNHWLKLRRKGVIFQGGCAHLSCHQSCISQVLWNSNEFCTIAVLEFILLLSFHCNFTVYICCVVYQNMPKHFTKHKQFFLYLRYITLPPHQWTKKSPHFQI